ncbi:hypothetical protein [Desulfobacter hydrogenophilus]|uniref:hypothetical protein n=1 Tax=Desulfobacter hydrogenophilus TaxID=2291 RepID=UPI001F5F95DD|nr:hypothetical protein [Desulfobacter hydrogenophilus]
MLNAIDKQILKEVAGFEKIPKGAYNIRKNGKLLCRKVSVNIDIRTHEEKSGIIVEIAPGTKNESLHIPVILSRAGKPLSFGQIIEKAIAIYTASQDQESNINDNLSVNINDNTNKVQGDKSTIPTRESQTEMFDEKPASGHIPDEIPDRADKEVYKAWLFSKISGLKDSGMGWVEIKERLNSQSIVTVMGKAWGRGVVQVFYKRELEKRGVNEYGCTNKNEIANKSISYNI